MRSRRWRNRCRRKSSSPASGTRNRTSATCSIASRTCLGKRWPAIDVSGDPDLILAAADDYSPTAVEERDGGLRIFFATSELRDRAAAALRASPVDVDDEDWARRAQPLAPVTVGRLTIVPSRRADPA